MVDGNSFSKKINQHSEEKKISLNETHSQLKDEKVKINQGINLYSSSIDRLIEDIAKWIFDTPIKLEINKQYVSDSLYRKNDSAQIIPYQVTFFTLLYDKVGIIFSPGGFIKYKHLHDGLIKIDVSKPGFLKAYDNIFLLRDKNGCDRWYFSDNKKRYPLDDESFKEFLLKTLGIE